MDLHSEVMNIPVPRDFDYSDFHSKVHAYKSGHRDARHAAAELALKADARIEVLEQALKSILDWQPTQHVQSIFDDHELWNHAEELLK